MTEKEWLNQNSIEHLLGFVRQMASRRKLRLFAVACIRNLLDLPFDQASRIALEIAEKYADGRATLGALRLLHISSENAKLDALLDASTRLDTLAVRILRVAQAITREEFDERSAIATLDALANVLKLSAIPYKLWGTAAGDEAALIPVECERSKQLHFFRDIFGNPFRPVSINPFWMTPTIKALAQFVYDDRAFNQMPLLAAELEKAWCKNEEILGHCRGPGPHVRGCWALDLVLGKG